MTDCVTQVAFDFMDAKNEFSDTQDTQVWSHTCCTV